MHIRLRMRGTLNRSALRRALDRIIARHEILRTTFESADGGFIQRIGPPDTVFALEEYRCPPSGIAGAMQDADAGSSDLAKGPLIHGQLLEMEELEHEHELAIAVHPVVADSWSVGVLIREIATLYSAYSAGSPDPLPPLERQFADFACMERQQMSGQRFKWRQEYWARALAGTPERIGLSAKGPGTGPGTYRTNRAAISFPDELYAQLQALAHRMEVPLIVPLLCGWAVLLARCSGQEDMLIGTHMPNRRAPELEHLIGPFENLIALRMRVHGDMPVKQLLRDVKSVVRRGRSHQDISFEQAAETLGVSCEAGAPLQLLMDVNGSPKEIIACRELKFSGLTVTDLAVVQPSSPFELALCIDERPDGLGGTLEYAEDLFDSQQSIAS
jgi:hypothetical protein